jgi:hypothetical protein
MAFGIVHAAPDGSARRTDQPTMIVSEKRRRRLAVPLSNVSGLPGWRSRMTSYEMCYLMRYLARGP